MSDLSRESIDDAIIASEYGGLDLMTSGPSVPNPATLFSMGKMRTLLDRLESLYAYIVIDSPPALYFADSVMLSIDVDAVLLVGRVNFSTSEVMSLARKKLQDANANIVGVVLNDIPLSGYQYYDSGYYTDAAETMHTNGNGNGRKMLDI